jgi:glutamine amidotransferase
VTAPRVAVIDYGSGNLRSAERALAKVGADVSVVASAVEAENADGVVVPGVGAFAACMTGVRSSGADALVRSRVAAERPVLGICVGMQVLYDSGEEHGVLSDGIGVVPGRVQLLDAPVLPHMGWNTVDASAGSQLFRGIEHQRFYFVHSYGVLAPSGSPDDGQTVATHGRSTFVAAFECGPLAATQFHPEKSGDAGLQLLENWVRSLV